MCKAFDEDRFLQRKSSGKDAHKISGCIVVETADFRHLLFPRALGDIRLLEFCNAAC